MQWSDNSVVLCTLNKLKNGPSKGSHLTRFTTFSFCTSKSWLQHTFVCITARITALLAITKNSRSEIGLQFNSCLTSVSCVLCNLASLVFQSKIQRRDPWLCIKTTSCDWCLGLLLCFLPICLFSTPELMNFHCQCTKYKVWDLSFYRWLPFSGRVRLLLYTKGLMRDNTISEDLILHFPQDAQYFRLTLFFLDASLNNNSRMDT